MHIASVETLLSRERISQSHKESSKLLLSHNYESIWISHQQAQLYANTNSTDQDISSTCNIHLSSSSATTATTSTTRIRFNRPTKCRKVNHTSTTPQIASAFVPHFVINAACYMFGGSNSGNKAVDQLLNSCWTMIGKPCMH